MDVVIAIILAIEIQSLLVGESATPDQIADIHTAVRRDAGFAPTDMVR
ncbi:hypothetical protein ACTMTJ_38220 [Phytohabitans sp. LJ34]